MAVDEDAKTLLQRLNSNLAHSKQQLLRCA